MYSCLKFAFFLISAGGTTTALTGRKFGESLTLTLMCCSLAMTVSGIFLGSLTPGYAMCVAWAMAFVPVFAVLLLSALKKKKLKELEGCFLSPGFFALLVSICLVLLIDRQNMYNAWDEFSHWGPMVKVMYQTNRLYCTSPASFAHHDYPPAAQLLEYLILRINGRLDERYVFRALQITTLSMTFPMIDEYAPREEEKLSFVRRMTGRLLHAMVFLAAVLILLSTMNAYGMSFYANIYTDILLAAEGGLLFFLLWQFDFTSYRSLYLGVFLAFLLLTKQMGLTYFLLAVVILLVRFILERKKPVYGRVLSPGLTAGNWILILGIPVFFYLLWNRYTHLLGLGGQFNMSYIMRNLFGFISGTSVQDYQRQVIRDFADALTGYDLTAFKASYVLFFLLYTIVCVILLLWLRNHDRKLLRETVPVLTCAWIGFILYAAALLALYVSGGFGEGEASALASYDRYMAAYPLSCALLLLGICSSIMAERNSYGGESVALLAGVSLFYIVLAGAWLGRLELGAFQSVVPAEEPEEVTRNRDYAEFIERNVSPDQKLIVVSQDDTGSQPNILNYFLLPEESDWISVGTAGEWKDYRTDLTPQEFREKLNDYDYIFLCRLNGEFYDKYAAICGLKKPAEGKLYRLNGAAPEEISW